MNYPQHVYYYCVRDLLAKEDIQAMAEIKQHIKSVNCLQHCLFVSYFSFRLCRLLRGSGREAARAGLLHDMFLYDQHRQENRQGHWKKHPAQALAHAQQVSELSGREENCILAHMWPLTKARPRCKEAWIVNVVDSLCALMEWTHLYHLMGMRKKLGALCIMAEKERLRQSAA